MNQFLLKLVCLAIMSNICSMGPIMQHETSISGFEITLQARHPQSHKWYLLSKKPISNKFYLDMIFYSPENGKTTVQLTLSVDLQILHISQGFSCVVLYDSTSAPNRVLINRYLSAPEDTIENLIQTSLISSNNSNLRKYAVANLCEALRIDDAVYHLNSSITQPSSKFVPDTLPTPIWTNPEFTGDFIYVAGDTGLYKYTSATKTYELILTNTFYKFKKIWNNNEAIVVLSWDNLQNPNQKNYSLQAFSIPLTGANYSLVGKVEGSYYEQNIQDPPKVALSQSLKTFVIYGKSTESAYFATGRIFDYKNKKQYTISIPNWITSTMNLISISDTYLYARNLIKKEGSDPPVFEHAAYFITHEGLTPYMSPKEIISAQQLNNQQTSRIFPSRNGRLYLIRQHTQISSFIKLYNEQVFLPQTIQFFLWDKKENNIDNMISGQNTYFQQLENEPRWFIQRWNSNSLKLTFQVIDIVSGSNGYEMRRSYKQVQLQTSGDKYLVKKLSQNKKCALIYQVGKPQLEIYDFNSIGSVTILTPVDASLYENINNQSNQTLFDISNNCKALRINNKILHFFSQDSKYYLDIYPQDVSSLPNPVFSQDFSIIVADNGIYSYTQKNSTSDGIYNLVRVETFYQSKIIKKFNNNFIIISFATVNNTNFPFKIQINSIVNGVPQKLDEFTFTLSSKQFNLYLSTKMTKIIIQGTSNNQAFYFAKNIDWLTKTIKNITLPDSISTIKTQIALSDEYLYVKNLYTDKKHSAYTFMGSTLIQAFNQHYPYPLGTDYSRTIILPDYTNKKRLVLGYQYVNNEFIRMFQDIRKSSLQILFPNPTSPFDLKIPSEQIKKYSSYPYFGKWVVMQPNLNNNTTTLRYIQCDPTKSDKKKVIQKNGLHQLSNIAAVSENIDCAVYYKNGITLDLMLINSTDSTINSIPIWATVVQSGHLTQIAVDTAFEQKNIYVGPQCQAFKIQNLVYIKNDADNTFTKSTVITGLTNPVFDKSLKYVYSDKKVYVRSGSDYVLNFEIDGLKSTVELYASQDSTKLFVLSYQKQGTTSKYESKLHLFFGDKQMQNAQFFSSVSTFTTVIGQPKVMYSQNMQNIGFFYQGGSQHAPYPIINLFHADYSSQTLKSYDIPQELTRNGISLELYLYQNYLLVVKQWNMYYSEHLYKMNKTTMKLIQIYKRSMSQAQFSDRKNQKIVSQSGILSILYELRSNSQVLITKKIIGDQLTQQIINGVDKSEHGLIIENNQIFLCPAGCQYCVNRKSCLSCLEGYVLQQSTNVCLKCFSLCKTCDSSNLLACTNCLDGYFIKDNLYQRCSDNCLTCNTNAFTCTQCNIGYYLSSNTCIPCIENCDTCQPLNDEDPLCKVCRNGYTYNSNMKSCVKCITGCTHCNPYKIHQCLKCADGYETFLIENKITCKQCQSNCQICTNGTCLQCKNGFRLKENKCIIACKLPCQQCQASDNTKCTSCIGGYKLNGTFCNHDLSCNINSSCTECPIGYNLIQGICYQCDGGQNCKTCLNNNNLMCASCNEGFYLSSQFLCQPCNIKGCLACNNQAFCKECKPGYLLTSQIGSGKCLKCDQECFTCQRSPSICITCVQGFTKKGWNCINNNNIKLTLQLQGLFADFTTENYTVIEEQICEKIGKDKKNVNIEQLKSSSIILVVSINFNNNAQKTAIMQNLQYTLTNGSSIGGFPIEQSALTAITADTDSNSSDNNNNNNGNNPGGQIAQVQDDSQINRNRNIAIIVGVVIPLGLILLSFILFMLYKKGIICNGQLKIFNNEERKVLDASNCEIIVVMPKDSSSANINAEQRN